MAVIINMHEAKTELPRLMAQAFAGEEVIIARAGMPVVRLTPLRQERIPGSAKGQAALPVNGQATLTKHPKWCYEGDAF